MKTRTALYFVAKVESFLAWWMPVPTVKLQPQYLYDYVNAPLNFQKYWHGPEFGWHPFVP